MSFTTDVQNSKSPREALLQLAAGLDVLLERVEALEGSSGWDSWGGDGSSFMTESWQETNVAGFTTPHTGPPPEVPKPPAVVVNTQDDLTEIMFREVSDERKARRRMFADQALHLNDALRDVDPNEDWIEVYVKGGPLWLYHGNRELLMTYPDSTRAMMVQDVLEDSPALAHEMSIDVLKQACDVPDVVAGERAIGIGEIDGHSLQR